uniref:Uncharacterized protein n=2 Tax=Avena sativa TaxID=4498 RepID=A0ACD5X2Z0_AVESA
MRRPGDRARPPRSSPRLEHPDPRFLRYANPVPAHADHTAILAVPEIRVTMLENGLRVATESSLAARTATVGVWIDTGSRYENEEADGVAHFLEHMLFKGTGTRGGGQLEKKIEDIGGHLNAYTSLEQTTYYANVLDKDVPRAMNILADILQNSKLDKQRIENERNVILREMQEVEGQSEEVIFEHLHATAFQYTSLGRPILGSSDDVKSITKESLEAYIKKHYTASRMVISVAGNVKHEDIVQQAKELFSNLPTDPTTDGMLVAKEPATFTGSEVRIIDDDMPLAQFAVAFNGASWADPDSIALMVMQTMLGSWNKSAGGGKHMGSELVQRVAINEIAESIMAFNTNYKDTGLFGVYAVAKSAGGGKHMGWVPSLFSELVQRVAISEIAESRIPIPEIFARIDAVDPSTIRRGANRFIFDQVHQRK